MDAIMKVSAAIVCIVVCIHQFRTTSSSNNKNAMDSGSKTTGDQLKKNTTDGPPLACKLRQLGDDHQSPRIIAIGDVHGSYEGLLELLYYSNITTSMEECAWKDQPEGGTLLVQMGDIVDRGSQSWEAFTCLRNLQQHAILHHSKVVRILGNHDMWWLEGLFHKRNKEHDSKEVILQMIKGLVDDIQTGAVVGAYVHHLSPAAITTSTTTAGTSIAANSAAEGTAGEEEKEEVVEGAAGIPVSGTPILFTHAGINANFYAYLETQLENNSAPISSKINVGADGNEQGNAKSRSSSSSSTVEATTHDSLLSAEAIAEYINSILTNQIKICRQFPCSKFTNQVFDAGPDRGGTGIGGPLWVDFSTLEATAEQQLHPRHFLQVVGHTMAYCYDPRRPGVHPPILQAECSLGLVRATAGLYSVCVDGGMYLGGRTFLEIGGRDAHFRAYQRHIPFTSSGGTGTTSTTGSSSTGTGSSPTSGNYPYQVRDLTQLICN
mmetsp:Transcript_25384/g.42311  ORF Transcript_25384/g.42311 Transcript_25384/m.42311 type:complete len:492 (-) Transcript_25384:70-1545(-)